ncbi:MAG: VCBS repeat-containing protein [Saprospiraceae bacterium]|nr:VCBS repeat-containing protein [Saprospiraceae bacterium]
MASQFSKEITLQQCSSNCNFSFADFVDVDLDGDIDFLPVEYRSKSIMYMENNGKGQFGTPKTILSNLPTLKSYLFTDWDFDGDMDIVTGYEALNKIVLHVNKGNFQFEPEIILMENIDLFNGSLHVEAEDLDADGKKEFVFSIYSTNGLHFIDVVHQDSVSVNKVLTNVKGSHRTKIYDMDQDGDFDVLNEPTGLESVFFVENDGTGQFNNYFPIATFNTNEYATTFDVGDLDLDGDIDLITGNYTSAIQVHFNDGQMKFTKVHVGSHKNPHVVLSDIDGDGDLDVYVDNTAVSPATSSINIAFWRENYGKGNFGPAQTIIPVESDPYIMHVADLDGDGDDEIIAVSDIKDRIYYYKNLFRTPYLEGLVFEDLNMNQIRENEEEKIFGHFLKITPEPVATVLSDNGYYKYYLDKGVYKISPKEDACYMLSGLSEMIIQIDTANQYRDVAVTRNSSKNHFGSYIHSGFTRCGFEVPVYLITKNEGCLPGRASTKVCFDSLATFISSDIAFSSVDGNCYTWESDSLDVQQSSKVTMILKIAGEEHIGEQIEIPVITKGIHEELMPADTTVFRSTINCSFDPNDKTIHPDRGGSRNVLKREPILYTIRFQNTGTDTAFQVEIRDRLSDQLDINSLQLIDQSHPGDVLWNTIDKKLKVTFRNILLPDSTTNYERSQGYLSFLIKAKDNLLNKSTITNMAEIYFDYNKPILTNLAKVRVVDAFTCADSIDHHGRDIFPLNYSILTKDNTCHNSLDGNIQIDFSKGLPPYQVNDSIVVETYELHSLPEGVYSFIVADSGNCNDTLTVIISTPDTLEATYIVNPTSGLGIHDGKITIQTIAGGTPPFQIYVNGILSPGYEIKNLQAGSYELKILDNNDCEFNATVEVGESVDTENTDIQSHPVISPNPMRDILEISIPNGSWKDGHYALYDVMGRLIYKNKWSSLTSSSLNAKINLGVFAKWGLFFRHEKRNGRSLFM